jgi:hypothetical protein
VYYLREFIEEFLRNDPTWKPRSQPHWTGGFPVIPGEEVPDCTNNTYCPESSKRIGLIGRKIGMTLQW